MGSFNTKIPSTESVKSKLNKHGKTDLIDKSQPIIEAAKPWEEKHVNLTLTEGFGSFRCTTNKFSNFLKARNSSKYCTAIKKVFNLLDNEKCIVRTLPFSLNEETLEINERQKKILNESDLHQSIRNKTIGKATYLDEVTRAFVADRKRGESIRFFFIEKSQGTDVIDIELILIDLYHLFATEDQPKINKSYKKISAYNINMNELLDSESN